MPIVDKSDKHALPRGLPIDICIIAFQEDIRENLTDQDLRKMVEKKLSF